MLAAAVLAAALRLFFVTAVPGRYLVHWLVLINDFACTVYGDNHGHSLSIDVGARGLPLVQLLACSTATGHTGMA